MSELLRVTGGQQAEEGQMSTGIKRILVTGGQGFIGSHLVDLLLEKGHSVTVYDRKDERVSFPQWKEVRFFLGDIRDSEAISDAISHHDAVFNLAGLLGTSEMVTTPREGVEANILGALNVYEAVRKHGKKCVQITVGNYTWLNTYAITKYTAERFALMYNQEYGTKIVVVRGLNVYGPRQKHAPIRKVVPNFVLRALKNETIEVFGEGNQLLDMIYVRDTAKILWVALELDHKVYDQTIEAGSGKPVTANHLAEIIIKAAKSKSQIKYLPMRTGEPAGSVTKADPKTLEPLNWRPEDFTPLEKGLAETIEWYARYYKEG